MLDYKSAAVGVQLAGSTCATDLPALGLAITGIADFFVVRSPQTVRLQVCKVCSSTGSATSSAILLVACQSVLQLKRLLNMVMLHQWH